MVIVSMSARLYQERRQPQFSQTFRGPGPQVYLPNNPVHSLKLEPPLARTPCNGCNTTADNVPEVDTGRTQVWPYGDDYAL